MFIFHRASAERFRGRPFGEEYDFRLNSRGFKDVEFTAKRPGVFRIVALGDSVAYGVVPYRDNFLTILEERLRAAGRAVEVLNMGVPATGPADYLSLFAAEGLDLSPDLVLVTFFIGNDFTDNFQRRRPLHSYSHLATFLRYVVRARHVTERLFPGHGAQTYDDAAPTFSDDMFLSIEARRGEIYRTTFTGLEAMAGQALDSLQRIKQLCDDARSGLLIVVIPGEVQVDPELQRRVLAAMRRAPTELDFARPNAILAEHLARHGIESLDLLPAFEAAARTARLYKPNDTHWNIAGNRLAAEVIDAHLAPRLR